MGSPEASGVIEEHHFLQRYRGAWKSAPYPVTFVTADALVLKSGHVLLVERKRNPGQGLWALPGGFVETDEPILQAALRELGEETALEVSREELLASLAEREVFDHPDRSQRGRIITHLACFRLKPGPLPVVHPHDDAAKAFWLPLSEVHAQGARFFDDHQDIIIHLTQKA
nr:NUDIX domain-containing protein [Geothrix alkalitolerans]